MDTRSEIFQNLNGASHELILFSQDNGDISLYNNFTQSVPSVIHGNGASKVFLVQIKKV